MTMNWKLLVVSGVLFCLCARVQAQPGAPTPQAEKKPVTKIAVRVMGDVARPGRYENLDHPQLLSLFAQAGGLIKAPKFLRVVVVRGNGCFLLGAAEKLLMGDPAMDFRLQDGDVVIVSAQPEEMAMASLLNLQSALDEAPTGDQFRVSGLVPHGGTFPWPAQGTLTLREAINQAGGFTSVLQTAKTPNGKATFKVLKGYISVKRWINGQKTSVLEWHNVDGSPDARWDTLLQKGDAVEVSASASVSSVPTSPRQASPRGRLWLLSGSP